jgi:glycosyltransferase involved in cell wall biosynthesis
MILTDAKLVLPKSEINGRKRVRVNSGEGSTRNSTVVLLIGPFPPPLHGAALVTNHIAQKLRALTEVDIVNVSSNHLRRSMPQHFTRFIRMSMAFGRLLWRSREIKAVYLSISGGLGQVYDSVLILTARILGHEIFLHHHSFAYIDKRSPVFSLLQKAAGPRAIHICLCDCMAAKLKAAYPNIRRLLTVPNAALAKYPKQPKSSRDDKIVLGHMSNLMLEKGIDTVLEAARQCVALKLPIQLVLAGPTLGPFVRAKIVAAQTEFGSKLDYRGPVYGDEKDRFFRDIDVFLFPSRYKNEAQPLVVIESLAAGVPVVAIARGCLTDDLADTGTLALTSDEFIDCVLFVVTQIVKSPDWLRKASGCATQRAQALTLISERAFAELVKQMATTDTTGDREASFLGRRPE